MSASPTTTAVVVTPQRSNRRPSSVPLLSPSNTSTSSRRMETALDVLSRALQGDAGAQRFLDQTSSIYVLDATCSSSSPKLFGCWNFLHHALNEMERSSDFPADCQQLLAQLAVKVARRSNAVDQRLVQTCIENYSSASNSNNNNNPSQLQWQASLIQENTQLRDIVMGRIAALALDPHNHHQHQHAQKKTQPWNASLTTFHYSMAANAVSNGPAAVKHLLLDWVIPSAGQLPAYSLVCVVQSIAQECSTMAFLPTGTIATLQQLSVAICTQLLGPVLKSSISNNSGEDNGDDDDETENGGDTHATSFSTTHRIAATALRALQAWCQVTDLSVAQVQHLCSKVRINLVEVLSDAMYSDSDQVVDALADLLEFVVEQHPPRQNEELQQEDGDDDRAMSSSTSVPLVSSRRFQQTRYIMGVEDEAAFRANISANQLYSIESKELGGILEELASAIALQRFRFVDRQAQNDLGVCHNLVRILCATCQGYAKVVTMMMQLERPNESVTTVQRCIPTSAAGGCLEFLSRCCAHPSVTMCAIVLPVVTPILATEVGLATQWLPLLQRRAIIPHNVVDGKVTLLASETSQVGYQEFEEHFRNTVLKDALAACYTIHSEYYLASCVAAIDEFCSSTDNSTSEQTSLHLEAALYCMAAIANETPRGPSTTGEETLQSRTRGALQKCTTSLAKKPKSLLSNPLTLKQACHFIRKYTNFYCTNDPAGVLDVAADLSLHVFNQCSTDFVNQPLSASMRTESGEWPFNEAALALEALLRRNPQHFLSNEAVAALGTGWEATFTACNHSGNLLTSEDRKAVCSGICHVLASLPESQQSMSLMALAMPLMGCWETMMNRADECERHDTQLNGILNRAASEMIVLVSLCRSFSDAVPDTTSSPSMLSESALGILHRAWPLISKAASMWSSNESILDALSVLLVQCLPSDSTNDVAISLLKELVALARSMVECHGGDRHNELFFRPTMECLIQYVQAYGETFRRVEIARRNPNPNDDVPSPTTRDREITTIFESLLLHSVSNMDYCLGNDWTKSRQLQGNGQPAFESQSNLTVATSTDTSMSDSGNGGAISNAGLYWLLTLLTGCLEKCPELLLPTQNCNNLEEDDDHHHHSNSELSAILSKATKAAVASLGDSEVELGMASVDFLRGLQSQPQYRLLLVQAKVLPSLIVACVCGRVNPRILKSASHLLFSILGTSPTEVGASTLIQALKGNFLLGPTAQSVILTALSRDATPVEEPKFVSMIQDCAALHHRISSGHSVTSLETSIAESDGVQEFCRSYA